MCSISNSFPLTLSDLKLDETSTSQLVSVSLKFICALALNCLLSLSFSPYSTDVIKSIFWNLFTIFLINQAIHWLYLHQL